MKYVEIRFKDRIDNKWASWFDGLELLATPENESVIRGKIEDFSALYGLIEKISGLGLEPVAIRYEQIGTNKSLHSGFLRRVTLISLCSSLFEDFLHSLTGGPASYAAADTAHHLF